MEEIIGDAMDSMDAEGLDAEADAEADRIVAELTGETLGAATVVPGKAVKSPHAAAPQAVEPEEEQVRVCGCSVMA